MSTFIPIRSKKKHKPTRPRLYFSISSEGYGHSSRAIAICRHFNNDEVVIGTYGYAYEKIKECGLPCIKLQQELKLVGKDGEFNIGKTIIKNHSWALTFNQIIQQEIDVIEAYGATCVVADGRLTPVMAADIVGIPCIVLTNQSAFYPFFEKDTALVKIFGKSFEWVMRTWLSSAEEILIPDFPPPHTVCLPNLSGNYKVMKRQRFVGPLVSWKRDEIEPFNRKSKRLFVVVTLGGHSYRRPLFDTILKVAEHLKHIDFGLFTSFTSAYVPSNVEINGFVSNIASYYKSADLIVTQAGHSTAMEILTLGKPALVVPDKNQIEQENNARRMCELGVATQMQYDELSVNNLAHRVQMMLESSCYSEAADTLAHLAIQIDGTKQAEAVLRDYSTRLMAY